MRNNVVIHRMRHIYVGAARTRLRQHVRDSADNDQKCIQTNKQLHRQPVVLASRQHNAARVTSNTENKARGQTKLKNTNKKIHRRKKR